MKDNHNKHNLYFLKIKKNQLSFSFVFSSLSMTPLESLRFNSMEKNNMDSLMN